MPINQKEVAIEGGSDDGKVFIVSQMSLIAGDRWSNRVALALFKSGVDVSSLGLKKDSFNGLFDIGRVVNVALKALGGIEESTAQNLLDELMTVIKVKLPDGKTRPVILQQEDQYNPDSGRIGDITCIKTLWKLRVEAIKVNLDFLMAGVTQ